MHVCFGSVFNLTKRHRWQWWSRRVGGTKKSADRQTIWAWQLDQNYVNKIDKHPILRLPHLQSHSLPFTIPRKLAFFCRWSFVVAAKQLRISAFIHNRPLNTYNEQCDKCYTPQHTHIHTQPNEIHLEVEARKKVWWIVCAGWFERTHSTWQRNDYQFIFNLPDDEFKWNGNMRFEQSDTTNVAIFTAPHYRDEQ